ncbi:MAG: MFS transporter [Bacillota bacterium]
MHTYPKLIKNEQLNKQQLVVFFSMAILYLFYYFAKYNMGPAAKFIQEDFGLTSTSMGLMFSIFTLIYACGHFVNGFLGDKYGPKNIMILGALGGAAANFSFGFAGDSFIWLTILWGVNGYFLSMGWAPGCSILYRWLPQNRWGQFMGIYSALCFAGGAIVYPIAGYSITIWGWRAAFIVPPLFLVAWALFFMMVGKNAPEETGDDPQWSVHEIEKKQDPKEKQRVINLQDYLYVFRNPLLNVANLAMMCSQFVRWGLLNWIIIILIEPISTGGYGMDIVEAALTASLIHWGGALFSVVFGYVSDRLFKGQRWQTIMAGFVVSSGILVFLAFQGTNITAKPGGFALLAFSLFLLGGCIHGVQVPLFNLPGDLLGYRLCGTGTGIMNGWSYIGASLAGVLLGWILDNQGYLGLLLVCASACFLGTAAAYSIKRRQNRNV